MPTLAIRAAIVFAMVLIALALWQMREAVQLLGIALAVAAGLSPLVERLTDKGLPRAQAALIIFGGGLLCVAACLAALGILVANDLAVLSDVLPLWYNRLRRELIFSGDWLGQIGMAMPGQPLESTSAEVSIGQVLFGVVSGAGIFVALVISVASLGFYWLVDQQHIERLWLSLLPLKVRTRVRAVWGEIYHEVGKYVRGEFVIITLTTLSLLIIFTLLQVPGAALLAIAGGLAQIIPLLGPPLAILPGAFAALANGQASAALALLGALAALLFIRLFLVPKLFQKGITVNPVLVIVLIMALFELGGLPLSLLGPPLAAALQASTRALVGEQRSQRAQTQPDQLSAFHEQIETISAEVDPSQPDAPRLQGLIERTRKVIGDVEQLKPS